MSDKKIKMIIQYDGTDYSGWQKQKKEKTVQGVLEEKLSCILNREIKIRGAGRTDAGVHALEQIAVFSSEIKMPINKLHQALNALLPKDIRIIGMDEVEDNFHPQYSAKKKSYIYFICLDDYVSCFLQRYVWNYPRKLDLKLMEEALDLFKGKKDFSALSGATDVKNKIRTIFDISMEVYSELSFLDIKFNGNFLKIRVEADGFLKNMARNIVGCLIEIGSKRLTKEEIAQFIEKKQRPNPLTTAPPNGLFLEKIFY